MKSKEDLYKEIINDLKKTGFVSEMHAMNNLISQNWRTTGSRGYFDLDESKTCEIDLYAYHTLTHKDEHNTIAAQSFFNIVAEVKKTDKPWIFFRGNHYNNWRLKEGWNTLVFSNGLSDKLSHKALTDVLLTSGLGYNSGWLAHNIHEAFKDPAQPSRWYSALIKACKAGEDVLKANSSEGHTHPYFFLVKPVVIVDGELISAYINEEGSIKLEQVDTAMMDFDFSTANYKGRRYAIDVVSLSFLPNYIKFCEKRHGKIFNELKLLKKV